MEPLPEVESKLYREIAAKLVEEFRLEVGLKATVNMVPFGTIPRVEFKAQSRRLIDKRPAAQ